MLFYLEENMKGVGVLNKQMRFTSLQLEINLVVYILQTPPALVTQDEFGLINFIANLVKIMYALIQHL